MVRVPVLSLHFDIETRYQPVTALFSSLPLRHGLPVHCQCRPRMEACNHCQAGDQIGGTNLPCTAQEYHIPGCMFVDTDGHPRHAAQPKYL